MKILIADDDPLAVQVLSILMRNSGIVIEVARNGLDAVDRVAAAPAGHFAAVLLDMRMPIMDGRDAARRIRDLPYSRGTLPIYAMSASEGELHRDPWASWLFDGHLMKPLNKDDLTALVAQPERAVSGRYRSKDNATDERRRNAADMKISLLTA